MTVPEFYEHAGVVLEDAEIASIRAAVEFKDAGDSPVVVDGIGGFRAKDEAAVVEPCGTRQFGQQGLIEPAGVEADAHAVGDVIELAEYTCIYPRDGFGERTGAVDRGFVEQAAMQ